MIILPLFDTTNQLLAGLTLLVVTVMLVRLGRPMWYTLAPLCFVLVMTIAALLLQLRTFYNDGNYFLLFLDIVVLFSALLLSTECVAALWRAAGEGRVRL